MFALSRGLKNQNNDIHLRHLEYVRNICGALKTTDFREEILADGTGYYRAVKFDKYLF